MRTGVEAMDHFRGIRLGTVIECENGYRVYHAGDTAVFGPEAEFFVFDDVRFTVEPHNCGFRIDSTELPHNTGTEYEMGNLVDYRRIVCFYFIVILYCCKQCQVKSYVVFG